MPNSETKSVAALFEDDRMHGSGTSKINIDFIIRCGLVAIKVGCEIVYPGEWTLMSQEYHREIGSIMKST